MRTYTHTNTISMRVDGNGEGRGNVPQRRALALLGELIEYTRPELDTLYRRAHLHDLSDLGAGVGFGFYDQTPAHVISNRYHRSRAEA